MGITTAWAISAHDDAFIGTLAPRLRPLIAAEGAEPLARVRWERWSRRPLPDHRTWWDRSVGPARATDRELESFLELTASGEHVQKMYDGLSSDDGFCVLPDVWERISDPDHLFVSVQSKDYAIRSLFHAIGPERAALLPGWCGNFLLTSAEVRDTLPRVEEALGFTPQERAAAQDQDWLDYGEGEERVLDGPLRMWRLAAAEGLGLCGVSVTVY
ncbi:hypothetical protein ACIBU0_34895 [Streptomyces sp. NPDC049627]|uniref:hypothetical protein n=1 Tax=Streptomyces sp. NPDC049627 TaxID=3365595 RepID=UPI0037911988